MDTKIKAVKFPNFTISENSPGSLLYDFQVLLDFCAENDQIVSAKKKELQPKAVLALNERLSHPIKQARKRPQQIVFPHINLLFLMAQELNFFRFETEGAKKLAKLNTDTAKSWSVLNPSERYFTLLAVWYKGLKYEFDNYVFEKLIECYSDRKGKVTQKNLQTILKEQRVHSVLAGMELFGMLKTTQAIPKPNAGWTISSLEFFSVGSWLAYKLSDYVRSSFDVALQLDARFSSAREEDKQLDVLFHAFKKEFPELKHSLQAPDIPYQKGRYIFKVTLHGAWRRLAIPDTLNFDELAGSILDAFDFDRDHLYVFEFENLNGAKKRFIYRAEADEIDTSEICLGEAGLYVKGNILFTFDFGDNWQFNVLLEEIDSSSRPLKKARLLESKGEAPEQYPDYDEEWY